MLVEVKLGSTTCQLNHFKPRALLGSDPQSAELTVADPSVSRRHAEVWLEGGEVYVRDLGSAAGTWVNGQLVGAQPVALAPGHMVHIGQSSLSVHWPAKGADARTNMSPPPPALVAAIAARQQQQAAPPAQPQYAYAPPTGPAGQYGQPMQGPGQAAQYGQPMQAQQAPGQAAQYGQPMQAQQPPGQAGQYGQPMPAPGQAGQYGQPMPAPASAGQYGQTPGQAGQSTPVQYAPGQHAQPPTQASHAQSSGQPAQYAQQPVPAGAPSAQQAQQTQGKAGTGVAAAVGVGGTAAPLPTELTYRRQGGNDNGTLLIALPGDTFANESTLDGFLEYTATDSETVVSVIIELIEFHDKGPKKGHVWDRCLVRQGPWKTKKGDVLPMPFRLRVPSGTSMSSPRCHWQLRGYVDIKWARDIEATAPINMRNTDIEKIRDALGSLDYRIAELKSTPLGQSYEGKFNPPMHMCKELNITDVNLDIEYVGVNLKVTMEVEKSKLFHRDKKQEFVFALERLRAAGVQDLARHWQAEINKLMA